MSTDKDLAALEAALAVDPASEDLHEQLLQAYCATPERITSPRRIEIIQWFVDHHPTNHLCITPFMHVDRNAAPDVYDRLKARWLVLMHQSPRDARIARAAAAWVVTESRTEAIGLLHVALVELPDAPELWIDLGRFTDDPVQSVTAFEKARVLGSRHPNLLVWIASTAAKARSDDKAEDVAMELMQLVSDARAQYGDRLDWPERGRALWLRARAETASDSEATKLSRAIAAHAYRKHWAHTVLGLVASHRGDVDGAVAHLIASAGVRPEHRLSAYGPSFDLLREVCERGRWDDGLAYLRAWEKMWPDERVQSWLANVAARRLPDAGDVGSER